MLLKIPAVLYYERIDSAETINYDVLHIPPDHSILTTDYSISKYVQATPTMAHRLTTWSAGIGASTSISRNCLQAMKYRIAALLYPSMRNLCRSSKKRWSTAQREYGSLSDLVEWR
jgi:hypothetical protein